MTSSERRREADLAKIRREEVERQAEAKLRLKKQEIQNQSMKGQLELDVVVEESRQKLAEATNEDAEYLEHASEICGFRRSRSKLAMAVGEPNGGRQDKKLGEHSIPRSGDSSARGTSSKYQPGTSLRVFVIFKY